MDRNQRVVEQHRALDVINLIAMKMNKTPQNVLNEAISVYQFLLGHASKGNRLFIQATPEQLVEFDVFLINRLPEASKRVQQIKDQFGIDNSVMVQAKNSETPVNDPIINDTPAPQEEKPMIFIPAFTASQKLPTDE